MSAVATQILWISLTTSLLLFPLLLLSKKIARRYEAKSCYILWLFLAIRLLLPIRFPNFSAVVTVELPYTPLITTEITHSRVEETYSALISASQVLGANEIWCIVWLVGAIFVSVYQIVLYLYVRFNLIRTSKEDIQKIKEVPVRRGPVNSPMTLGMIHPVIFLPEKMGPEDTEMALHHELCHIRRKDLIYKAVFLVSSCIHWFNPLVWWMSRVAGECLEYCCDRDVVDGQTIDFRRKYGQLLLCCASDRSAHAWMTPLGGTNMKGRIMNLFVAKKRGIALIFGVVCAVGIMGGTLGYQTQAAQVEQPGQSVSSQDRSLQGLIPIWPVEGEVTLSQLFGRRVHPITGQISEHYGVDILAPEGTHIMAAMNGMVSQTGYDKVLGNYVLLCHDGAYSTLYSHLKGVAVESGTAVIAGDIIGEVGRTGQATGNFLHYEVWVDDSRVDPLDLYPDIQFALQDETLFR